MSLFALVRGKGGGAATTSALALAAAWPEDRPVIYAELDPSGGDVAQRFLGGPADPSVISLADDMRQPGWSAGATGERLRAHAVRILGSIDAVLAPASSHEVRGPLEVIGRQAHAFAAADFDVVADCGLLEPAGPREAVTSVLKASALVLLVTAPRQSALVHAASWVQPLSDLCGRPPSLLLVEPGDGTSEREIFEELRVGIVGKLPHDRDAARFLEGNHLDRGLGLRRRGGPALLPLLRSARSIAEHLAPRAADAPAPLAAAADGRTA